ncbi:hypothetical protein [Neobacillus terrae]|uniref:hypothetical protein n=1 Tax=Neobacillus terrae TaxID=3034837 RepID=UPI001FB11A95|nr:hypothetical protein [Neobacillus terrae]
MSAAEKAASREVIRKPIPFPASRPQKAPFGVLLYRAISEEALTPDMYWTKAKLE